METPSIDQFIDFSYAHALHYQGTGLVTSEICKMFLLLQITGHSALLS